MHRQHDECLQSLSESHSLYRLPDEDAVPCPGKCANCARKQGNVLDVVLKRKQLQLFSSSTETKPICLCCLAGSFHQEVTGWGNNMRRMDYSKKFDYLIDFFQEEPDICSAHPSLSIVRRCIKQGAKISPGTLKRACMIRRIATGKAEEQHIRQYAFLWKKQLLWLHRNQKIVEKNRCLRELYAVYTTLERAPTLKEMEELQHYIDLIDQEGLSEKPILEDGEQLIW